MSGIDEFFDITTEADDPLREELIAMIEDQYNNHPRNLQVELGPSEVGHPCMRKMAFALMQVPRSNPVYNPLPSYIGTATHTRLEGAAQLANERLGRTRWLIETVVDVTPGLKGHCDLYDCDTATVIDWKVPNSSRVKMYKEHMSPAYRNQVHLYGKGFENAGYPVKRVAIALLPRSGSLRGMYYWSEDYDPARVAAVLQRRNQTIALIDDMRIEDHPERYEWIPKEPYDCVWCDWWSPHPRDFNQCKGDQ